MIAAATKADVQRIAKRFGGAIGALAGLVEGQRELDAAGDAHFVVAPIVIDSG